jgi:hypothetical protein
MTELVAKRYIVFFQAEISATKGEAEIQRGAIWN